MQQTGNSTCVCCDDCGTEAGKEHWLNKDCCGLVCAVVTQLLLLFGEYAFVTVVIQPWYKDSTAGYLHITAFTIIVVLGMTSHLKAMCTDPGAVPKNAVPLDFEPGDKGASYTICLKCDSYKPIRAHHCSICQRCITKLDHHCPWVNNCVGLGNHKFFLLFLLYVFLASAYALTMLSFRFVHCTGRGGTRRRNRLRGKHFQENVLGLDDEAIAPPSPSPPIELYPECALPVGSNVLVFVLLIEAILFGLFTMCMMCDQWSVVLTSVTKIDKLKGAVATKRDICDNLTEVFGGQKRFSVTWLLPTQVKWYRQENVFGFKVHDERELEGLSSVVVADSNDVGIEMSDSLEQRPLTKEQEDPTSVDI